MNLEECELSAVLRCYSQTLEEDPKEQQPSHHSHFWALCKRGYVFSFFFSPEVLTEATSIMIINKSEHFYGAYSVSDNDRRMVFPGGDQQLGLGQQVPKTFFGRAFQSR